MAIQSPNDGTVFYTPTNITMVADADLSVTNVEFFAGTDDLGKGVIEAVSGFGAGWLLTWTNPPPSDYALTAVGTSLGGIITTSAPVNITVQPGPPPTNLPPVVEIFSPTNGATFFGRIVCPPCVTNNPPCEAPCHFEGPDIAICANASDPDDAVATVEFFANGQSFGIRTNYSGVPPQNPINSFCLVWSNAPTGNYVLTAIATDTRGATGQSAPVSISVQGAPPPTNSPPIVVRIISPPNGAVFRAPINLPLFAFFTYPHVPFEWGSVGFYDGTNFLGVGQPVSTPTPDGPTPSPVPVPPTSLSTNIYELVWSNAPVGNHVLTAAAVVGNLLNSAILRIISAPVNITILPPLPPPTNRPPIVDIVASDPVAVEGTNCWVWLGETNLVSFTWTNDNYSSSAWAAWPASACRAFTNCGPKTATFAVHRFGDTNSDLTVPYAIGGTASNGVDYVTLPSFATIPAGERRVLITIVPIEDGPPDVNKTVVLTLEPSTNLPPDYLVGFPPRAAAIIIDPSGHRHPVSGLLPGGCFHLAASGPEAAWFCVEYSTDLLHWTPVCTNQVINGSIDFVDPDAQLSPSRFYRAVPVNNVPSD